MSRSLTVAFIYALACTAPACRSTSPPTLARHPRLPAAVGSAKEGDPSIVVQLPDTGGWFINTNPVRPESLESKITQILASRGRYRSIFAWYNPKRPWSDYERLSRAAEAAGGHAYDAQLTFGTEYPYAAPAVDIPRRR